MDNFFISWSNKILKLFSSVRAVLIKIFRHFLLGDECATVEICIVALVAAKENSVFLYRVHDDSLRKKLGYQVVNMATNWFYATFQLIQLNILHRYKAVLTFVVGTLEALIHTICSFKYLNFEYEYKRPTPVSPFRFYLVFVVSKEHY